MSLSLTLHVYHTPLATESPKDNSDSREGGRLWVEAEKKYTYKTSRYKVGFVGLGIAAWPWTLPPKALGLRAVRSRYIDKGVGNCGVGVGV